MARVVAVKIVAANGTPNEIIGYSVAILKRLIKRKTTGSQSHRYKGFTLLFEPAKKRVTVTYELEEALTLRGNNIMYTLGGDDQPGARVISSISLYATEDAPASADLVEAVGLAPIAEYASISIAQVAATYDGNWKSYAYTDTMYGQYSSQYLSNLMNLGLAGTSSLLRSMKAIATVSPDSDPAFPVEEFATYLLLNIPPAGQLYVGTNEGGDRVIFMPILANAQILEEYAADVVVSNTMTIGRDIASLPNQKPLPVDVVGYKYGVQHYAILTEQQYFMLTGNLTYADAIPGIGTVAPTEVVKFSIAFTDTVNTKIIELDTLNADKSLTEVAMTEAYLSGKLPVTETRTTFIIDVSDILTHTSDIVFAHYASLRGDYYYSDGHLVISGGIFRYVYRVSFTQYNASTIDGVVRATEYPVSGFLRNIGEVEVVSLHKYLFGSATDYPTVAVIRNNESLDTSPYVGTSNEMIESATMAGPFYDIGRFDAEGEAVIVKYDVTEGSNGWYGSFARSRRISTRPSTIGGYIETNMEVLDNLSTRVTYEGGVFITEQLTPEIESVYNETTSSSKAKSDAGIYQDYLDISFSFTTSANETLRLPGGSFDYGKQQQSGSFAFHYEPVFGNIALDPFYRRGQIDIIQSGPTYGGGYFSKTEPHQYIINVDDTDIPPIPADVDVDGEFTVNGYVSKATRNTIKVDGEYVAINSALVQHVDNHILGAANRQGYVLYYKDRDLITPNATVLEPSSQLSIRVAQVTQQFKFTSAFYIKEEIISAATLRTFGSNSGTTYSSYYNELTSTQYVDNFTMKTTHPITACRKPRSQALTYAYDTASYLRPIFGTTGYIGSRVPQSESSYLPYAAWDLVANWELPEFYDPILPGWIPQPSEYMAFYWGLNFSATDRYRQTPYVTYVQHTRNAKTLLEGAVIDYQSIFHWVRDGHDTDGLCIITILLDYYVYRELVEDYTDAFIAGDRELIDSIGAQLDAGREISVNNFATNDLMRLMYPGASYEYRDPSFNV